MEHMLPGPGVMDRPFYNPYVVGRPLTGSSEWLFVGRDDVFAWLAANLGAPRPNALLLYGERRIGKTSTLYQLVEGSRGQSIRQAGGRVLIPVYLDLQRLVGCGTDEWLRRLGGEVYRRAGSHLDGDEHAFFLHETTGAGSAFTIVEETFDFLERRLAGDAVIVVVIDELEQLWAGLESGRLDPSLMPFLRSQVQHRSRFTFLFSGSHGLLADEWRPLLDLTARRELGPLDGAAATALIREPSAGLLEFDAAAVELIRQATGDRPLPIQRICHRLVALRLAPSDARPVAPAPVHAEHVQSVVEELAAEGSYMESGEPRPVQNQVKP